MSQCTECDEVFGSTGSFDAHRVGEHDFTFIEGVHQSPPRFDGRRCLAVSEMEALGFHRDRWGRWRQAAALEPHLIERVSL